MEPENYRPKVIVKHRHLSPSGNQALDAVIQAYNLNNKATCFQSNNPTCIDLILTNRKNLFDLSNTFDLSDHHKLVSTILKSRRFKGTPQMKVYRSLKKINIENCNSVLKNKLENLSNHSYLEFEKVFLNESNRHTPLKKKMLRDANIMNDYFINITNSWNLKKRFSASNGDPSKFESHISIKMIHEKDREITPEKLNFELFPDNNVEKKIENSGVKMSLAYGSIPASISKQHEDAYLLQITNFINYFFQHNSFPQELKISKVMPLYKKLDSLQKKNFRPVNLLKESLTYKLPTT